MTVIGSLIDDGYTATGYINDAKEIHGLRGSLKFSYRPMLPREVEIVNSAVRDSPAKKGSELLAAAIKKHVVDWDATDAKGEAAPLNLGNINRLPWSMFNKTYDIISGAVLSDLPDDATEDESDDYAKRLLQEAESDHPAGRAQRDADLGNSEPG